MKHISSKSYLKVAGHQVLPALNEDQYPKRPGLEGPFRQPSGHVLYYDTKEGSYYDASSDMYVSNEQYEAMQFPRK